MQLRGRPREAFEIIKARLNGTNEVRITDIEKALGYSPVNFRLNIRRDEAFLAACAVEGIEEGSSETLTAANGKPALVFRRRPKPPGVASRSRRR
jgi:hypothetical protein